MEKISIVTPCYNASAFIRETYNSLKSQSCENWVWIVIDDSSTDESVSILEDLASEDERVVILKNEKNEGAAVSRNKGLDHVETEFCAFLDVDDFWCADKLTKQMAFMKMNNLDFSYHAYSIVTYKGEPLKRINLRKVYAYWDLLKFNPFMTSSIMIRKSFIEVQNLKFRKHLRRRQDYMFWYDMLKSGAKVGGIDEYLASYRVGNQNSLSANKYKMAKIQWRLYREEFKLGFLKSFYYICHYSLNGIKKYFF